AEAMTLGRRLAVMNAGLLEQCGSPDEVYSRPANLFVAGFLGNPSMNFLPGRIDAAARVFASGQLSLPLSAAQLERLAGSASITLGVRPENVELDRQPREGWIAGRVYVSEAMGNENLVVVEIGGYRLSCRTAPEMQLDFESPVWLRLRPDRLHFFDTATTRSLWP
ncbi:MAG TPA: TOBE domain-containing protein, partial [Bryobacterales bacterium]|nr:TOBE domain-containing protein [Bryobacterales bacterium]